MIGNKQAELIKAIKNHKCCGKSDSSQGGEEGSTQSQSLLMSLIPSDYPKPTLFLYMRSNEDDNPVDVTNYKIEDFLSLHKQEERNELYIQCLYQSSNLSAPIIKDIHFGIDGYSIYFSIDYIPNGNVLVNEFSYNNKLYYFYDMNVS